MRALVLDQDSEGGYSLTLNRAGQPPTRFGAANMKITDSCYAAPTAPSTEKKTPMTSPYSQRDFLPQRVLPILVALCITTISLNGFDTCVHAAQLPGRLVSHMATPRLAAVASGLLADVNAMSGAFGVSPQVFFIDEQGGPNAFASPTVLKPHPRATGTILLGVKLVDSQLDDPRKMMGPWNFTLPAVLAHEMGHIAQYSRRLALPTLHQELHADALSGWYIARRSEWDGVTGQALRTIFYQVETSGDYSFWNPNFHGTPEDRIAAFRIGMELSRMPFAAAFDEAARRVVSIRTPGSHNRQVAGAQWGCLLDDAAMDDGATNARKQSPVVDVPELTDLDSFLGHSPTTKTTTEGHSAGSVEEYLAR